MSIWKSLKKLATADYNLGRARPPKTANPEFLTTPRDPRDLPIAGRSPTVSASADTSYPTLKSALILARRDGWDTIVAYDNIIVTTNNTKEISKFWTTAQFKEYLEELKAR